ncbi:MAG: plastocyanin/azurin family copper-binding protein [Pseudolabrys sp.]
MNGLRMSMAAAFVAGAAAAYAVAAYAAEHTIGQKGKVFSKADITIKAGDSIVFVNDDNIPHNVMSMNPDNKFNLGSLRPGSATPVTFKAAGDVEVICAIHPSMKMRVKVAN